MMRNGLSLAAGVPLPPQLIRLWLSVCFVLLCSSLFWAQKKEAWPTPLAAIDPFIGTSGAGGHHPGPAWPGGRVQVAPISDLPNPQPLYQYGEPALRGFHFFCPPLGSLPPDAGLTLYPAIDPASAGQATGYSAEKAAAGWYQVQLANGIGAQLTVTPRTGAAEYLFPVGTTPQILLDCTPFDTQQSETLVQLRGANEIEGFHRSGMKGQKNGPTELFFVVRINQNHTAHQILHAGKPLNADRSRTDSGKVQVLLRFAPTAVPLLVQCAFSFISIDNARLNLEKEWGTKSFAMVRQEAAQAWAQQLDRLAIEGGTRAQHRQFYTALYHLLAQPAVLQDVNGEYPGLEKGTALQAPANRNRLSGFALPFTVATTHPLLTLLFPERTADAIQSLLGMRREYGWIPAAENHGKVIELVHGSDPAALLINDAYQRGIRNFDVEIALNALIANTQPQSFQGLPNPVRFDPTTYLNNLGFLDGSTPSGVASPAFDLVGTSLFYNLADWNIAQMARSLNKPAEQNNFARLAKGYRYLFDAQTKTFRQRNAAGSWVEPSSPGIPAHQINRFFLPHDLAGLMSLYGGGSALLDTLDAYFQRPQWSWQMPTQWAYPYLYTHLPGAEWKTQAVIEKLLGSFSDQPNGLPAADIGGSLSAWLVLNLLGLYPDCPGRPSFQVGAPAFTRIAIDLDPNYYSGKTLIIEQKAPLSPGSWIRELRWNGKKVDGFQLQHQMLTEGGRLSLLRE